MFVDYIDFVYIYIANYMLIPVVQHKACDISHSQYLWLLRLSI